MCMCVTAHVWTGAQICAGAGAHIFKHVWRSTLGVISHLPSFFETGSLLSLELTALAGWLANPRDPSVSASLTLGL